MSFCTVINCMDGRVQEPVIKYLKKRFNVDHVDTITEPGPNLILAEHSDAHIIDSILTRLKISVERHNSKAVAIVGHHDCAGNPAPRELQFIHIEKAIHFIRQYYPDIEIIGLWIDEDWRVNEIPPR